MKTVSWATLLAGIVIFCTLVSFTGCASTLDVARVDPSTPIDVSGRWNDTDSRKTAEEMISDCLAHPWIARFNQTHADQKPVIIIGAVLNRSHEHIDTQTFLKAMERELFNSDTVVFVASPFERQEIRQEREDMAVYASDDSFKGPGMEAGADYMLQGAIRTLVDETEGTRVVYYQINLELIDMLTNRKAWVGETRIKKIITRPRVKW